MCKEKKKEIKKAKVQCPKCGKWELMNIGDYQFMAMANMVMCSSCLDKFNQELFFGKLD